MQGTPNYHIEITTRRAVRAVEMIEFFSDVLEASLVTQGGSLRVQQKCFVASIV